MFGWNSVIWMQHSGYAAWVAQDVALFLYSVAGSHAINPPHRIVWGIDKLRVCHLSLVCVLAQNPVTH
jgi:hypothetical protein